MAMVGGIQDLLRKDMTRKQFIVAVGFGLVSILGFSKLLELFGKKDPLQTSVGYDSGYSSEYYSGYKKEQIK